MRENFDLTNPDELRNFLKKHGVWAKKKFGQNFLQDRNALEKIVVCGEIQEGETVVEIGPGHGVLTRELLKAGAKVEAIEIDSSILPALKDATYPFRDRLEIFHQHVLDFVPPKGPYKCISNIPYHLTSPLLRKFLVDAENRPTKMVFLMQKEVAEKIACKEEKDSLLSILIKTYGEPKIAFTVPAESFFPAPKVTSAVLVIDTFPTPKTSLPPPAYFAMLVSGFKEPRKKLKNVLAKQFLLDEKRIEEIFSSLNIHPDARAQNVKIPQWEALTKLFYGKMLSQEVDAFSPLL